MSYLGACARELETLVARALRRGRLDARELLEAYTDLQPGNHPHVSNPRRVDIEAVAGALTQLPEGILEAVDVLVVRRLHLYTHEPRNSTVLPAAVLADGTLIVEAAFGIVSLFNLVAPMCLLAHEADKARRLLAQANVTLADVDRHFSGAHPASELPQSEQEPGPQAYELQVPESVPQVAAADHGAADGARYQATMARVAFHFGVDQATLEATDRECGGVLTRLLLGELQVPVLRIHADLAPDAVGERAARRAQRVLQTMAEMGLLGRPMHLWVGDGVISDCLSPYARELRPLLLRWATQHPELTGNDIERLDESAGEDILYALVRDFLASDPDLVNERREADRTVGIFRQECEGLPFEIIDLGRIDVALCDARLPPWHADTSSAPVLLRLPPDREDVAAVGLRAMVEGLATSVAGVTVVLEGTPLAESPGTVILPQLMICWAGEVKLSVPDATPFDATQMVVHAEQSVRQGAVLSAPSVSLLSPAWVGELAGRFGVAAIEIGGSGLIAALADARWSGALSSSVTCRWALVGSVAASTGRPSVATLHGLSAVALSTLRSICTGPTRQQPAAPEPPAHRKGPSSRAVRIKA